MIDPKEYQGIQNPEKMDNLEEEAVWDDGVYEVEADDILTGGKTGLANLQARQLANRTLWLRNHIDESIKKSSKIKSLEKLILELYEAQEDTSTPSDVSGMLVENFNGDAKEIDWTEVPLAKVPAAGATSLEASNSGIESGKYYWLDNGKTSAYIQTKSVENSKNITLSSPTKNAYTKVPKLRRSTVTIKDGKAYGTTGDEIVDALQKPATFTGRYEEAREATIDFTKYSDFKISGAVKKDGKLSAGAIAYGIVLNTTGGGAGDWRRINIDGNDLTKADIEGFIDTPTSTVKPPQKSPDNIAYGIVLNATGGGKGDWRLIDVKGNDLTQEALEKG